MFVASHELHSQRVRFASFSPVGPYSSESAPPRKASATLIIASRFSRSSPHRSRFVPAPVRRHVGAPGAARRADEAFQPRDVQEGRFGREADAARSREAYGRRPQAHRIAARHPCAGDALGLEVGDGGRAGAKAALSACYLLARTQSAAGTSLNLLKEWCCKRGLNSLPLPYQGSALPLSYCSIQALACAIAADDRQDARRARGGGRGGVPGAPVLRVNPQESCNCNFYNRG